MVADGYKGYKNLARYGPGYRLALCWAHVLRKFRDIAETEVRYGWMLERIGKLYEVERVIALAAANDPARHLQMRQQEMQPLLEEIRLGRSLKGGLRRRDFGKAVARRPCFSCPSAEANSDGKHIPLPSLIICHKALEEKRFRCLLIALHPCSCKSPSEGFYLSHFLATSLPLPSGNTHGKAGFFKQVEHLLSWKSMSRKGRHQSHAHAPTIILHVTQDCQKILTRPIHCAMMSDLQKKVSIILN